MGKIKEFVLLKIILPITDLKFHSGISAWFRQIARMQKWKPSQIEEWQNAKMRELVQDAYRYSPYYRNLFDSLSLSPDSIRTKKDLEKIPPLTKEIIRDHFDEIVLQGKRDLSYRICSTGGSTGNPTRYFKDNNSWGFINAFTILRWKEVGYHYGDKFLALGSASIFPVTKKSFFHDLYYRMKGKIPFNAMNLSEERLQECVELLKRKKIHYIYGYASSIFLLAKYVEDNHLESSLVIRACFPTSEILTDVYRETMERVFKCPVSDMYGAHDGGIIAHKIDTAYKVGYNCIVQTDAVEEMGVAYLTDVTNKAFPFIRYQLGDEVELGDGYNDFYNGQIINKVIGRTSDVIRLGNGRVLTGPGFTILFSKLPVKGYRIYKSGPLQISIEIIKEDAFNSKDEQLVLDTMHKHAGSDCDIVIKYADSIQTRANGKNLYFLN